MNQFMEEALKEANTGIENGHGGPFGAVVVRNQEIIGKGHNCVLLNHDPTAHGEIMAIRDACQRLGSFSLNGISCPSKRDEVEARTIFCTPY